MTVLRSFFYAVILIIVSLAIATYFAGTTLTVANDTVRSISNLRVKFVQGSIELPILEGNESHETFIGKIGEGNEFIVTWNDAAAVEHGAKIQVYFGSTSFFDDLRITISNDGRVNLNEDGRIIEATETW